MANSEEKDLMSIGKHCNEEYCKQIDFLPFKCDSCSKEYCISHWKPSHHSCTLSLVKDSVIPKCPLCDKLIEKGVQGSDDNTQVEQHILSGCKSNLLVKRKKNRCNFSQCKAVSLIPFHCSKCYGGYCVRHRHPNDHQCHRSSNHPLVKAN